MEKIKIKSGVLLSANDVPEVKKAKLLGVFMAIYSVFVVVQNLFEMKTLRVLPPGCSHLATIS